MCSMQSFLWFTPISFHFSLCPVQFTFTFNSYANSNEFKCTYLIGMTVFHANVFQTSFQCIFSRRLIQFSSLLIDIHQFHIQIQTLWVYSHFFLFFSPFTFDFRFRFNSFKLIWCMVAKYGFPITSFWLLLCNGSKRVIRSAECFDCKPVLNTDTCA